MRIDEFGALPDGQITTEDRIRFCCFGLDIASIITIPTNVKITNYIDYNFTIGSYIDYKYKIRGSIDV